MFVPGVTNRQNDQGESWFALGAVDPDQQDRVENVAKLLRCSGRVEVTNDIKSCKWMKLVVNAAELIPSAILNLPLGDAARFPGFLEVMRQAGYEAMQAALLDGASIIPIIGLPPITTNDPERYVDRIFDEVLQDIFQARHANVLFAGLAQGTPRGNRRSQRICDRHAA